MTRRGVDTAHEGESLIDIATSHLYGNFAIMTIEEAYDFAVVAVEAIIEALAAEAEAQSLALVEREPIPGTYLVHEGGDVADWLRAHLDAGRDGEDGT